MEKLLIHVKVAGLMEGRLLHGAVMFAVCDRQKGPKMQTHQRNLTQNSVLLLDSKRTKQTGKLSWSVGVSICGCWSPLLPFGVEPTWTLLHAISRRAS